MTTPTITPAKPVALLTLADACDACGYTDDTDSSGHRHRGAISSAYVRVTFPNGHELLFCGHHYAAYELELATHAVTVHDQREDLTVKPGYSA